MTTKNKIQAWIWVGLCSLAIFTIIPLARTIQKFVSDRWGRSLFGYVVLVLVVAAFLALLYVLIFKLKVRSPANYIWLTAIALLYGYFTLRLWRTPEVAIHFPMYGLLGFFLFRALSLFIRDKSIYLVAFILGSLVGTLDEILQWIIPGRYWDFADVGLNALAGGLFQVAVWQGIKPGFIAGKFSPRSLRRVSILLAAQVLLLGLCASNTPERLARFVRRFPSFAFLLREEPMYEFTKKHVDSEIGVFYSRLSLDGLKKNDDERSDEWGQILRQWKDKEYGQFLANYSPFLHPFLYEMRVHVFRRDRKFEEARRAKNEEARKETLFIAFKENLILEKYFGRTLEKSSYRWSAEETAGVGAAVDRDKRYRSPVSAGPFHIKEKALRTGILAFLGALAVVNFLFAARARKTA